MERNWMDAMQDRERRIQESKIRMDKIRELSFERTSNPPTNQITTLPSNNKKYKTKQMEIDDILIKK